MENVSLSSSSWRICDFCQDKEGLGPISKYGDFTPCFLDGVLLNATSLLMLAFGLKEIARLCRGPHPGIKFRRHWLLASRMTLVMFQIVLACIAIGKADSELEQQWASVSQRILGLASLCVALPLHWIEYHRSRVSNGVLLFFWLFEGLFTLFRAVHFKILLSYEEFLPVSHAGYVLTIFQSVTSFFILLLEAKFQKPQLGLADLSSSSRRKRNPYDSANIFSKISFSWMTQLMKTGYEKYLTETDLYNLPAEFGSADISRKFGQHWDYEVKHRAKPSLAWAMCVTFGGKMIVGACFKALYDILAFTQPQLLKSLIKFVTDYTDQNAFSQVPIVKGFMLSIGMFLVSVFQTSLLHQYFLRAFDTGMNAKSGLTSVIYQKALVLSNEASSASSTGDIVNLMSVDVQRIQDLTQWGQIIWSGPFQLILCLVSLYKLLGNSMWIGVIIMVITIPANSLIMRYQKKLQKVQMKYKDGRTRLISEILNNIKSLKLYAWEEPYRKKLDYVRNEKELKNLRRMGITNACASFQFNVIPFLVSCSTFGVFIWTQDAPLTTDLVFPALTLFNLLAFPLAVIPTAITAFVEASVSITRLQSFLTNEELQRDSVQRKSKVTKKGEVAVNVGADATFLWQRKPEYKVALKNINFAAKKGKLTCVVGKVGSGKSALIQAILGDLFRVKGFASVHGSIAYVSQVPWIMNGTVKDNILFGHKYDESFYTMTLKACALIVDLAVLPKGDQTLVGEKGISLSGGQKARLSLARAVYARADTYLLDDPLAAVDEHVTKHLVEHVLGPNGLLASKTKVLATNKITVLSIADHIALLENGEIIQQGSYDDVTSAKSSALSKIISTFGKKPEKSKTGENTVATTPELGAIAGSEIDLKKLDDKLIQEDTRSLRRASDATLRSLGFDDEEQPSLREHREQGKVKWDVYMEYAKACNPKHVLLFLAFVVLSMFLSVMSSVWLKHWSEVNTKYGFNPNSSKYLTVLFLLGVGSAISTLIQTVILWVYCTIHGSRYLHNIMADAVFKAPMSFFETTPIGRILNRFSNDIFKVDELLGRTFAQFFVNAIKVSFTIIVICFSTWQFILVILPMGTLYIYYQQYYLRTSRELRRLDSVTRSPIYAHFQETLGGISTIRGYNQQKRFVHINQARVDNNMSAYYPSVNANRWLAFRLEFIGSVIILAASSLSVLRLKQGALTPGMIGLSVSYALQITQSLNWIVRMTVEVETNIVSVERIKEYANLESEAPAVIESNRPSEDWPSQGSIKFENYSARYRPELELSLKDINLDIKPQERIGIVGRTGAGKSSLTLALFRIIEAASGRIYIDGLPIDSIGLRDLRHHLSIIPQDSQLFEGTIRENIDPTNEYTDEQIWRALELSHLKDHVKGLGKEELDAPLTEGGSNLSVGQRQLMCLARALLIPSKILVLDEATAAVDVETDQVIQETIRTAFKNRTILTIAHRINTILDSDRILVLDSGKVAEFDTPDNLLKNPESLFYSLCYEAGVLKN
ncbi:ATP-binding cassette glutathione S-conjugate transporter YCF1 [Lachancea thermotolerans CBS 6340]|uniref:KLTH0G12716p n=1 Tax=Lachancea thermotolerans (strain ATCC 56472 / CBS 6340 / NRRL Y-8284) TaxID=559295 RepID=C5DMY7_LACTC|nr:KLTH0G12716p [Lachancea thermotolerans CBS 6340]CAR25148.1 KLTH0G12716p [Lachancea thermotolerans CBS 6340]